METNKQNQKQQPFNSDLRPITTITKKRKKNPILTLFRFFFMYICTLYFIMISLKPQWNTGITEFINYKKAEKKLNTSIIHLIIN